MTYHYVYYSYEEYGRGYIGVRSCRCLPSEDITYFGSFTDKTFYPTEKIILEQFNAREEALAAEIVLHRFYQVQVNPHFANKALQTSTKFSTFGVSMPEDFRVKIKLAVGGEKNPFYGKSHSAETRRKISKAKLGKSLSDRHRKNIGEGGKGKSHSVETRAKMSKARAEYWNKRRLQGSINISQEHRRKISEAQKSRKPVSAGTRKRLSEAIKEYWRKKKLKPV